MDPDLSEACERVCQKAQHHGLKSLTETERALYVVSCVELWITSECIYAVFDRTPELLPYAVDALIDVGLPRHATIFATMLKLLPEPAEGDDERFDQVMAIQEEDPDLNDKIQGLNHQFDTPAARQALHQFFQKHRAELLPDQ